jgi:hypothetical protein
VRCPRCGNENPESNRFCGMCGATLRPTQVSAPVQTAAHAASQIPVASPPISRSVPAPSSAIPVQTVTASRPASSATEERPASISGPSFLGLNDPPPQKRSSLSITQGHDSSSRNLDYLLDDEEPPRSSAWKMLVIIIVLAVAVGLGYMRWKNPSLALGSLFSRIGKPAAVTQPSQTTDSNGPDTSAGTATPPSSAPPSSTPADTTPAPATPANNAAPDKNTTPDKSTAADKTPPAETPAASAPDNTAASHPPVAPPAKPKHKAEPDPNLAPPMAAKTSVPADTSAKFSGSVSEAQKYIYGKGVQQDCDHGLRILKPAADHANPKAMIEMGALYSAGLCTPRDLPTAYRWFALALRKEPDNQSVQTDLKKLWSEMTQPERQLAIKLSQ